MAFLRLPDSAVVRLVDTEAALENCRRLLDDAYVCTLDAEWKPGSRKPSATLVQLALKRRPDSSHVLLLDMLALPAPACKAFLQQLFRAKAVLKVGYALANDLRAVATALGPQGGSCIAAVQPCIDLRRLDLELQRDCPARLPELAGRGLGSLAEALLGGGLDKSLQCSSWQERPLSPEQVQYAALDAACLLGLLQRFVQLCPPGASEASGARTAAEDAVEPQQPEAVGARPHGEAAGNSTSAEPSLEPAERVAAGAAATDSAAEPSPADGTGLCRAAASVDGAGLTRGEAEAAAAAWSGRIEFVGAAAQFVRRGQLEPALEDGAAGDTAIPRLPARIPWRVKGAASSEAKFVADVPQEGLARQLRLCGFDAKVAPKQAKEKRHLVHRFLVQCAELEGRVILTGDRLFIRRRQSSQAFLVQRGDKRAQLADVLQAFGLSVQAADMLSRCAKCNGRFEPRPLTFEQLPELGRRQVPPAVLRESREPQFWVCADCQQVYWRGSQFTNCLDHLCARLRVQPLLSPG